ncbi:MAG: sugar-binding protein [Candidatus Brocadiia bacterium]
MRKYCLILLILVAVAVRCGAAKEDSARVVNLYDVRRIEQPPVIDGKLDEKCWQDKPVITDMVLRDASTRIRAKVQTSTKIIYDDKAIYVGIHMNEPNPAGLRKRIKKYDGPLWWDDSVEIYLESGCSHEEYFKFMSTPLGTRADWRARETPMGFKLFDWGTGTDWKVEAHIADDYWALEFRFPYADLETKPPKPGDLWSFEIVRFRYANPKGGHEYSAWDRGATHASPQRYGNIVFSGTTSELEKMFSQNLAPVFGEKLKMYGEKGVITYTTYPEMRADRMREVRQLIAQIRHKTDALAGRLDKKSLQNARESVSKIVKSLEELSQNKPGPGVTEALSKLKKRCRSTLWMVRYHELNASIPAVEKK